MQFWDKTEALDLEVRTLCESSFKPEELQVNISVHCFTDVEEECALRAGGTGGLSDVPSALSHGKCRLVSHHPTLPYGIPGIRCIPVSLP